MPSWIRASLVALLCLMAASERAVTADKTVVTLSRRAAEADLATAVRANPRVQILFVNSPRIGDAELVELKGLEHLWMLALTRTQVTDAGLAHLARLPRLEALFLAECNVTDAGMAHLAKLSRLRVLSLAGTRVTEKGLAALAGLGSLEALTLPGKTTTDASLKRLAPFRRLRELSLGGSRLVSDRGLLQLLGLPWLHQLLGWRRLKVSGAVRARVEAHLKQAAKTYQQRPLDGSTAKRIARMVRLLEDPDSMAMGMASNELEAIGRPSVPALTRLIEDRRKPVGARMAAGGLLEGFSGLAAIDPAVREQLRKTLKQVGYTVMGFTKPGGK